MWSHGAVWHCWPLPRIKKGFQVPAKWGAGSTSTTGGLTRALGTRSRVHTRPTPLHTHTHTHTHRHRHTQTHTVANAFGLSNFIYGAVFSMAGSQCIILLILKFLCQLSVCPKPVPPESNTHQLRVSHSLLAVLSRSWNTTWTSVKGGFCRGFFSLRRIWILFLYFLPLFLSVVNNAGLPELSPDIWEHSTFSNNTRQTGLKTWAVRQCETFWESSSPGFGYTHEEKSLHGM